MKLFLVQSTSLRRSGAATEGRTTPGLRTGRRTAELRGRQTPQSCVLYIILVNRGQDSLSETQTRSEFFKLSFFYFVYFKNLVREDC